MAKWQHSATDVAQRTVLEILMEMERFKYRAGEEDLGAGALVPDVARAFDRVSLPVVWGWATHFSFPEKIVGSLWVFLSRPLTAVLSGSEWSCLLLQIVLQDASSEVT